MERLKTTTCFEAVASFVKFFGEPDGDGLVDGLTERFRVRWMIFRDDQKLLVHKNHLQYHL